MISGLEENPMNYNIQNRERFTPQAGHVYDNAGGGRYLCNNVIVDGSAWFTNVKSGWHFYASGIGIYPDGRIDWDQSCLGRFEEVPAK